MAEPPAKRKQDEAAKAVPTESDSKRARKNEQHSDTSFIPKASPRYSKSFGHDSVVTSVASSDEIVVTGTKSGVVTFWKKKGSSLENLRQFVAHPKKSITSLVLTDDGKKLASFAKGDEMVKIFDLSTLDMVQSVQIKKATSDSGDGEVDCAVWCKYDNVDKLALAEGKTIRIIDPEASEDSEDKENGAISSVNVHKFPVTALAYNSKYGFVISTDSKGFIEYWVPGGSFQFPEDKVKFKFKTETQLFDLTKSKTTSKLLVFSKDFEKFATSSSDGVRVWDVTTGKIMNKIGKEIAREFSSVSFDPTGQYLIVGDSETGSIRIISLATNSVTYTLGEQDAKDYHYQFEGYNLLNNTSEVSNFNIDMISSDNTLLKSKLQRNPILVSLAQNSNKIFVFANEDGKEKEGESRDFSIEDNKVSKSTHSTTNGRNSALLSQYNHVTLHTTSGDIKIKLFNSQTPKTVENFLLLCQKKYYDHVVFHRVIKKFMLQTGDPLGDGTGGESAWGGYFKDEFNPILRHNKPFLVSMANSGPNTNGSQFFITTEKAPWLDGKHTIFGEVVEGKEAVRSIEAEETDKNDRPLNQVVILSTTES